MRVTIIPSDGIVAVDGRTIVAINMSSLPVGVHAVQWYGSKGEVEFSMDEEGHKPANEIIENLDEYQAVLDAWEAKRAIEDAPSEPTAPGIPTSVSPLQARKALRQQDLLAMVQAAVDAADIDTQDAWEYATSFDRTSPFVLGMAQVLGWTEQQLDDLFVLAATL